MVDEQGPICISVINMKGGVGKTTVAAMLSRYAASLRPFSSTDSVEGRIINTLAIDLDPQANLSQALMEPNEYRTYLDAQLPSIVEAFEGYQPPTLANPSLSPIAVDQVVRQVSPGLHLLPSKFDFSHYLVDSVRPNRRILAQLIASEFQDKELVLIDCAPTESILTQAAYHASRYVLVPVKPEFLATIGFPLLNNSLESFRRSNQGHQIDVIGVVINDTFDYQADDRTPEKDMALEEIYEVANTNGWDIFDNRLEYSRGFPKIMRGEFRWSGDAPLLTANFAEEFFQRLGSF